MPYCWKCGTRLDEDAKFCPVCGTLVGEVSAGLPPPPPPPPRPAPRRAWSPLYTLAIVLGSILILGLVVGSLFFLPVRTVSFNQSEQVLLEPGTNAANLDLSADVATFNITFDNLNGSMMTLNVSANGGVGWLAPSEPMSVTVDHSRVGNTLFIDSRVSRAGVWWPFSGGLDVVCDVRIDRSVNLTLKVTTSVGKIVMNAPPNVVFDSLELKTTTGEVDASLRSVGVNGPITVQSTTGSVDFAWDNLKVAGNVSVAVRTTTGSVHVNVTQQSPMLGNVTLKGETVTGSVNLLMTIHDGVGASISSSTTTGGINTNVTRFSGLKSPLYSENYPAPNNFIVALQTTTGGVNVEGTYRPDGHA